MTISRAAEKRRFVHSSAAGWIGLILAALMSTLYAAWFASRPLYNWDMIPYVAIALLDVGHSADSLRQKTYEIMERGSPIGAHEFLFGGSEYKKDTYNRGADFRYMVAHDSKTFADILPFYTVKPVYPALMSLLVRAGVNPVTATMIISGASYAAICLLLYVWISRWLNPAISLLVTALLSLNPVLIPLAQLATPDSLSVFILLFGTFLAIELRYPATAITVFVLSILIRPENIIYVFIFSVYLLSTGRLVLIKTLVASALAFAIYFVQTRLSHSYGWIVFFNFTFFDWTVLENPSKISPNPFDYINAYTKEIFRMFFTRGAVFPLFVLVGLGALLLRYDPPQSWRDPYVQLVLLSAVYMIARTAAIPGESDRALVFPYALIIVSFIHACIFLHKKRA
jgi:hypothetical protein